MPLQIIRQDITKTKVVAIVNTSKADMIGYSGVDLVIHENAGPELDAECRRRAPLRDGEAIGRYRSAGAANLAEKTHIKSLRFFLYYPFFLNMTENTTKPVNIS